MELIRQLKQAGVSIILISHNLHEILAVSRYFRRIPARGWYPGSCEALEDRARGRQHLATWPVGASLELIDDRHES